MEHTVDLSPIGRAAFEAREGCRLLAYRDTQGILTIGYGHTSAAGPPLVESGMLLSQDEADELFAVDVEKYVATVRSALKVPVPQEFFDACCSFCYNVGQGGFKGSSVVRLANAGNLPAAIEAFLLWDKPDAILTRRQGEHDQAGTPYSKSLPYARRGDHAPIKAPRGTVVAITRPPDPPPATEPTAAPSQPAPSGGLSSAPSAPVAPERRSLFSVIADLFRNPKKEA